MYLLYTLYRINVQFVATWAKPAATYRLFIPLSLPLSLSISHTLSSCIRDLFYFAPPEPRAYVILYLEILYGVRVYNIVISLRRERERERERERDCSDLCVAAVRGQELASSSHYIYEPTVI